MSSDIADAIERADGFARVVGGHLLLFVTRTERLFLLPPLAAPLVLAILLTQVIAALMCGLGWIIPSIEWSLIGWVWVYDIVWMCALGGIRLLAERFASYRTVRQELSLARLNQPLRQHATS